MRPRLHLDNLFPLLPFNDWMTLRTLYEIACREEEKFCVWARTLGVDSAAEAFILGMFWGEFIGDFREKCRSEK